jgi:hypothetical protein
MGGWAKGSYSLLASRLGTWLFGYSVCKQYYSVFTSSCLCAKSFVKYDSLITELLG